MCVCVCVCLCVCVCVYMCFGVCECVTCRHQVFVSPHLCVCVCACACACASCVCPIQPSVCALRVNNSPDRRDITPHRSEVRVQLCHRDNRGNMWSETSALRPAGGWRRRGGGVAPAAPALVVQRPALKHCFPN